MKYNKVIILHWANYNQRITDLFTVTELLKEGIVVEYWDVSDITIPGYHTGNTNLPEGLLERKIQSKREFKLLVIDNKHSLFVVYMNYCRYSYHCYRVLSYNKCNMLYCINGSIPEIENNIRKKAYLNQIINHFSFKEFNNLVKEMVVRMVAKTPIIHPVDYVLKTCSKASPLGGCKVGDKTKYLDYNSNDYQNFLTNTIAAQEGGDFITFLDEYLPFHPDNLVNNGYIDSQSYYAEINSLFDKIESFYKKRVVVAAHPSSVKYHHTNYFNGREVQFGKTRELVEKSYAVIVQESTSISFPVLYKKPIISICTESIKDTPFHCYEYSRMFSQILNTPYVFVKGDYTLPDKLVADLEAYNKYKYLYLTNPSTENISNSVILLNILKGDE